MYFGNVVMTTPVIGEAGDLGPAVDASTIVGADMTNNSIEEELHLTVAFNSITDLLPSPSDDCLGLTGEAE